MMVLLLLLDCGVDFGAELTTVLLDDLLILWLGVDLGTAVLLVVGVLLLVTFVARVEEVTAFLSVEGARLIALGITTRGADAVCRSDSAATREPLPRPLPLRPEELPAVDVLLLAGAPTARTTSPFSWRSIVSGRTARR